MRKMESSRGRIVPDLPMDESTNEGALDHNVGEMDVMATGEGGEDPVAGGWQGTDDAISTAPSDLAGIDGPRILDSPEGTAMHIEDYSGALSEMSEEDEDAVNTASKL